MTAVATPEDDPILAQLREDFRTHASRALGRELTAEEAERVRQQYLSLGYRIAAATQSQRPRR